jgi:hypothetical protein
MDIDTSCRFVRIHISDWFYGKYLDYFLNFEIRPVSGLRLPPYLEWVETWFENHWIVAQTPDLLQIGIAMRNNWELIDELVVTEDSRGNVIDAFECLTAIDPNTDEMHEWHSSLPDLQDHQEAINDLQEGRFPPQCLCQMCLVGRDIVTDSMHQFLAAHEAANQLLRESMPGKFKF